MAKAISSILANRSGTQLDVPSATYSLELLNTSGQKEVRAIAKRGLILIGSDSRCEWRVNSKTIAAKHLCIRERNGKYFVEAIQGEVKVGNTKLSAITPGKKVAFLEVNKPVFFGAYRLTLVKAGQTAKTSSNPTFSQQASKQAINTPAKRCSLAKDLLEPQQTAISAMMPPAAWQAPERSSRWIMVCMVLFGFALTIVTTYTLTRHFGESQTIPSSSVAALQSQPHQTAPMQSAQLSSTTQMPAANQVSLSNTDPSFQKPFENIDIGGTEEQADEFMISNFLYIAPQADKPYGLASSKGRSKRYDATIKRAAQIYDLDPTLIKAVIHAESNFNPFAVSHAGAQGLMQLMPQTANDMDLDDSFHPSNNILSGSKLLKKLLIKYDQNVDLALAAYNAGEGAVAKYGGIPPYRETQDYVKKVKRLRIAYRVKQAEQYQK